MSRLTYKLKEPLKISHLNIEYLINANYDIGADDSVKISNDKIYNKLGQFEDIEEWIEKGLYLRFNGGIYYFKKIVTDFKMIGFCTDRDIAWYYISDYGKMFALTKEELI